MTVIAGTHFDMHAVWMIALPELKPHAEPNLRQPGLVAFEFRKHDTH